MSSVHGHENHEFLSSHIGIMPVPVVYGGVSQDIQVYGFWGAKFTSSNSVNVDRRFYVFSEVMGHHNDSQVDTLIYPHDNPPSSYISIYSIVQSALISTFA